MPRVPRVARRRRSTVATLHPWLQADAPSGLSKRPDRQFVNAKGVGSPSKRARTGGWDPGDSRPFQRLPERLALIRFTPLLRRLGGLLRLR